MCHSPPKIHTPPSPSPPPIAAAVEAKKLCDWERTRNKPLIRCFVKWPINKFLIKDAPNLLRLHSVLCPAVDWLWLWRWERWSTISLIAAETVPIGHLITNDEEEFWEKKKNEKGSLCFACKSSSFTRSFHRRTTMDSLTHSDWLPCHSTQSSRLFKSPPKAGSN